MGVSGAIAVAMLDLIRLGGHGGRGGGLVGILIALALTGLAVWALSSRGRTQN
jgi:hypothetical protein